MFGWGSEQAMRRNSLARINNSLAVHLSVHLFWISSINMQQTLRQARKQICPNQMCNRNKLGFCYSILSTEHSANITSSKFYLTYCVKFDLSPRSYRNVVDSSSTNKERKCVDLNPISHWITSDDELRNNIRKQHGCRVWMRSAQRMIMPHTTATVLSAYDLCAAALQGGWWFKWSATYTLFRSSEAIIPDWSRERVCCWLLEPPCTMVHLRTLAPGFSIRISMTFCSWEVR